MSEATAPTATTKKSYSIRPIGTHLLVKKDDAKEKSKGGILIPDNAKDAPKTGTVIETGPGKELANGVVVKPYAKKGDRVLFSDYAGVVVKVDNVPHLIIEDSDVLAIIDAEASYID